jgi:hypothetical protein
MKSSDALLPEFDHGARAAIAGSSKEDFMKSWSLQRRYHRFMPFDREGN